MQVIVNGLMTQYVRSGTGKTIVLLHGWGDSHKTFEHLHKMLSTAYDVIALDLPGFGKSDVPKNSWKLIDYAEFIRDFLKKISVKEVEVFIGHSNGGAIAIRGIGQKKLQAKKLVLLASSGIRGEYKGRAKAMRFVAKTGKFITTPLPKSIKKRLRKSVYNSIGSDMLVAENMQETFKNIVSDDVQADAPNVKMPTLLMYGTLDTATPVRYGDRYRDLIPHARLEVINGATHFIHHDKPDTVERHIVEFLQ